MENEKGGEVGDWGGFKVVEVLLEGFGEFAGGFLGRWWCGVEAIGAEGGGTEKAPEGGEGVRSCHGLNIAGLSGGYLSSWRGV